MRDLEHWARRRPRWLWWAWRIPELTCGGCRAPWPCRWALLPPWVPLAPTPAGLDAEPDRGWVEQVKVRLLTATSQSVGWLRSHLHRGER